MEITSGTRLGPYEIVAPLGAGGMGEVWKAHDRRLDRSVAIKILPAEFSTNAQLKVRFEREAKIISQLNHPNICTLFDIGHDGGTDYLVMEMIEGESLADRISRGPMPLADVIRDGSEIATALEKAHRAGIVHRDLKPGNVIITKNGAKLLDFGLAKTEASGLGPRASVGATEQKPLTQEGAILGTLQYMAPEQLEGLDADARTDVFALGALLYEMATGVRAFQGKSRTSLIAAIVSSEPRPVSQVRPVTPPALERLIHACLAKDPDARMQSAHDVAVQLRWISEMETAGRPPSPGSWFPYALAGLFAAAAVAAIILLYLRAAKPPAAPIRFTIPAPPQTGLEGIPAVSPDGRRIVFRAVSSEGSSMLWLRSLDTLELKPLKGTEGANHVFWSPDGKQIGFSARSKLWRMDAEGGNVRALYEPLEQIPGGGTWNQNGVILFSPRAEGQLYRIPATGGEAVKVTKDNEINIWPWFLPDGDHFLYCVGISGKTGIYAGSLSSDERKLLIPLNEIAPQRIAYASGYIVYNRGPALYAQKFDARKLAVTGDPQKIEDEIEFFAPGRAAFSVSPGGTLVYHETGSALVSQMMFVDSSGRDLAPVGPPGPISDFRLSPDDRRIVYQSTAAEAAPWLLDVARGASSRIAFDRWAGLPLFMPDGRSIVYTAAVDTPPNIFLRHDDGSIERLMKTPLQNYPTDVTPDGKFVIAYISDPQTDYDLVAIPVASPHTPVPLARTKFKEWEGAVSPNGKWIAYTSDETGQRQIYAMAMPNGGRRVQMSTQGGRAPRWSRDGRKVYFVHQGQKTLYEVSVTVEDGDLRPSSPKALFSPVSVDYDVARDGRFLIVRQKINPDAPPLSVVMNWTSILK